jgi:FlgD Ig-like domain
LQRVLTTVTLLGLLVATAAAFVITEHLKLIKSPVYGTLVSKVFSPVCHCSTSKAVVRIKLRHADRVTVTIVDSQHHRVATVASGFHMVARQAHSFTWDGRTNAGTLAPDGVYYPWVHLTDSHRTLRFVNRITLDTTVPAVLSASGEKDVLFAGPGRSVAIKYALSEQAHAVVYLGHRRLVVGRPTRTHGKIKWGGTVGGEAVREGRYVLSIAARDAAGNETRPAVRKRVTVVVRYIQVTPRRIAVQSGKRLVVRVETDAARYTWRLGRQHGARRGKVLKLHAPTTPGTYRLVVREHGHSSTALVRVRAK